MATLIGAYNQALRLMGERRLASTSEARDARYHLDDAYSDALDYCLEQGLWNFAMRAVTVTASGTITVAFGFQNAFEKPTDWLRTFQIANNENFVPQLDHYHDEAGVWFADATPLYVRYVSNHSTYGANLGNWPGTFSYYVSSRLAVMTAKVICSASDPLMEELYGVEKRARVDARSKDAMNEGPIYPPAGSWLQSRRGRMQRPRSLTLGY